MIKPTDAPGFEEVLEKIRNAKDDRPRHLGVGWHELAIDRCSRLYREHLPSSKHLFVVEGVVLRSTAEGFAGQRWSYVCALKLRTAHRTMEQIASATGGEVERVASEAETCSRYGLRWPDEVVEVQPAIIILADVVEKRLRSMPDRTVFAASFARAT